MNRPGRGDSIEFQPDSAERSGPTLGTAVFRSLVFCLLAGAALAGCATFSSAESEAKAVSQAHAIAQRMSTAPVTLIATHSGQFAKLVPGAATGGPNPGGPVWAVDFEGSFTLSCAQSDAPQNCPVNTTVRVVLDEGTGNFVIAESPAPNS